MAKLQWHTYQPVSLKQATSALQRLPSSVVDRRTHSVFHEAVIGLRPGFLVGYGSEPCA